MKEMEVSKMMPVSGLDNWIYKMVTFTEKNLVSGKDHKFHF